MPTQPSEFPPVALEITVRFAETDLMGVVHHSAYIVWFEAARIEWMRVAGVPYHTVDAAGYNFAVTEVSAQYRAAIRFGDPVRLVSRLTSLRSRSVAFAYEVRHGESDALLATGHSSHICVDRDGRSVTIPDWVMAGLRGSTP